MAHPAFVDCAQALMARPAGELLDDLSEGALFRLGPGITSCLTILADELRDGAEWRLHVSDDPVLLANTLYASGLGALHLARLGILVKEAAPASTRCPPPRSPPGHRSPWTRRVDSAALAADWWLRGCRGACRRGWLTLTPRPA